MNNPIPQMPVVSQSPLMVEAITRLKNRLCSVEQLSDSLQFRVNMIDALDTINKSPVPDSINPEPKCLFDEVSIAINRLEAIERRLESCVGRLSTQLG